MAETVDQDTYFGVWNSDLNKDYCLTCAEEMVPGITQDEEIMSEYGITALECERQDIFCNGCKAQIEGRK